MICSWFVMESDGDWGVNLLTACQKMPRVTSHPKLGGTLMLMVGTRFLQVRDMTRC